MSIQSEWDSIAWERLQDRLQGNDYSYNNVFLPIINNSVGQFNGDNLKVLDFGCGTGELTYELSTNYPEMEFVGVDISKYSLELANRYFSRTNLKFVSSLDQMESFAFDLIIANMSLMDTEDLDQNLSSLSRLLVENGRFFIIITHPSFWPLYWDYANNATFKYTQQHKITKEYKTKNKTFSGFQTTHFHRPLSSYINGLIRYSFKLQEMRELQGKNDIEWYSRFLYLEFIKERTD